MFEISKFVGRKDELKLIHKTLFQKDSLDVFLINGEGGIGKTWLLRKIYDDINKISLTQKITTTGLLDFANPDTLIPLSLEYEICYDGKIRLDLT